MKMEKVQYDVG